MGVTEGDLSVGVDVILGNCTILMNPKNSYSPALQEDARRFEVRLNGVSARQFGIKDMLDGHAGVEDFFGGIVWEVTRVV